MKRNMGTGDQLIRFGIAVIILVLYFTQIINGALAIILLVVSGILIFTSFVSFCPLYLPFGINTKKKIEH
ncbi:hypothetical protein A5893_04105 [Pedobacter psychrophilus]|uniref:Inner membrane protein YgaP-like transmembrane domain-containing protein n=1 Tax=Pedobacter psychrophilus TaxID=1826909 RepID=A0A179DP57_9SPHI|nr:DUF2892 domain-containing protein [Pedobacter psychrophilus]OAQ42303.1 hypothetical protein A5893_04105 [Pedobacter psychrophilus]